MNFLSKIFRRLFNTLTPYPTENLEFWQERTFNILMTSSLGVALIAYIPSIIACVRLKILNVLILDTAALLLISFFTLFFKIPFKIRVIGVLSTIYLLSVFLIIFIGPFGVGLLWMLAFSVFAGIFLPLRPALISVITNALTLIVMGLMLVFHLFDKNAMINFYSPDSWWANTANFVALNLLLTVSIGLLLNQLRFFIKKEIIIRNQLNEEKEKLFIAKQKSEKADYLKSAFLANMSHEIRTPLNGIIGFTELLKQDDIDEQSRHEYYKLIDISGKQLQVLIEDIIDFSRIETGQLKLFYKPLFLNEQLRQTKQTFDPIIHENNKTNLQIIIRVGLTDEESRFTCDPVRFIQVINNLVGNAIKFTQNGYIEIVYRKIENEEQKPELLFCVKDTGIGISEENQKIIFGRFLQIEETHNRKYGGTGLGLAISKSLIELMNGKMWVESTVGKGSAFYFTLPYLQVEI